MQINLAMHFNKLCIDMIFECIVSAGMSNLLSANRTLVAGGDCGYADGVRTAARFRSPGAVTVQDRGTLPVSYVFVADTGNNVIRRIAVQSTR